MTLDISQRIIRYFTKFNPQKLTMKYRIENDAIALGYTHRVDVDAIFELESRQENSRFVMAYTKERHLQVIDSADEEHLTIWDKSDAGIAGFVILAGLTNPNMSLEFRRLVIHSKGKGLGRQTLRLLKKYFFEVLKFHRVWFDVYEDNERAIHLYRSEGFMEEGKLREVVKEGDSYRSLLLFSMLEREYKSLK